ncbi:MAG: hypothetical protein JSV89_19555 [Spirochaetaceae bacterium]|nr:MAG: hypothetical protein JSV89_19555 [Spirochaetaceae bacterium]
MERRRQPDTPHLPEPGFDFPAYLEAKFAIDSASLNAPLYAQFKDLLRQKVNPRILDLGTGTGAMLRRIMELDVRGQVRLVGLDQEEESLAAGLKRIEQVLRGKGFSVSGKRADTRNKRIHAEKGGTELQVDLLQGDLLDAKTTEKLGTFDCITAHAFMDLMPLKSAAATIRSLLRAEGVFYSTLNYDGQTVLLPEYGDAGFERRLLRNYDRSMERRRYGGRRTGGALSGRRLFRALLEEGFTILGTGSSDWNVSPSSGSYTAKEILFLTAILSMIAREAWTQLTAPPIRSRDDGYRVVQQKRLNDWFVSRIEAARSGRLSLVVHQLDHLARIT